MSLIFTSHVTDVNSSCLIHDVDKDITKCCSVFQCVAVCCSVLQFVAECCSVLQRAAVCCSVLQCVAVYVPDMNESCLTQDVGKEIAAFAPEGVTGFAMFVAVCCSVLQCVVVCCSMQHTALCCSLCT